LTELTELRHDSVTTAMCMFDDRSEFVKFSWSVNDRWGFWRA
jgi:hypothetical protein